MLDLSLLAVAGTAVLFQCDQVLLRGTVLVHVVGFLHRLVV